MNSPQRHSNSPAELCLVVANASAPCKLPSERGLGVATSLGLARSPTLYPPAPLQATFQGLSSSGSPQGIFVRNLKKQQTCRKDKRTEMCNSCKNPKLKSKCKFTTQLPVRSVNLPEKTEVITIASCRKAGRTEKCEGCKRKKKCMLKTVPQNPEAALKEAQQLQTPKSPEFEKSSRQADLKFPSPVGVDVLKEGAQKALLRKAKMKDFWFKVVEKCMQEQQTKHPDNQKNPDWWKCFDIYLKEKNYGERVSIVRKVCTKLFRTTDFAGILCFLIRYEGVDAKKSLEDLIKIQQPKIKPVKLSARKMVKLKCIFGGSSTQLYKVAGGLKRLSKGAIQCESKSEVVKLKRSMKCPQIFEHTNPSTQKKVARYCKFQDVLKFTYGTPGIARHMNFKFPGQDRPVALYVNYGDGTKQTRHVELTNLLCRNMNLGRVTRNPAALQIFFLDAAKNREEY